MIMADTNNIPVPTGATFAPVESEAVPVPQGATFSPVTPVSDVNPGTMSAPPKTTPGGLLDTAAQAVIDPIGSVSKALDHVTSSIENYTQQGRAEHPILSRIGDATREAKELLTGGQSAGKPLGTSSGVTNNPVTIAMSTAPGAAELGAEAEQRLTQGLEAIKSARVARTATAAQEAAAKVATVKPVDPAQFVYREPSPVPQHGAPVQVDSPLDNATINKLPGGKDLSANAIETLKQHVGGTPGAEIEAGSSPKNTLMKAVEPVQQTIKDTGIKMNDLIQNSPPFRSTVKDDGTLVDVMDELKNNIPASDRAKLSLDVDDELKNANDAMISFDPNEVLAYRRKLGSQIDWNDIPRNPQTPGEVQNVAKVKIYKALGDKIHTEVPGAAELDKVFQPNLELQSHLDAKLGRTVSRDPVEANAQQRSELLKGKAQLENKAHNDIVAKNRDLAGLSESDIKPTITGANVPKTPVDVAVDKALDQFNVPVTEKPALRDILDVKAGTYYGTNTDWVNARNTFDKLSPAERAARFSNPEEVRSVLQKQAKRQAVKAILKYGSIGAAAIGTGIDRYILHAAATGE